MLSLALRTASPVQAVDGSSPEPDGAFHAEALAARGNLRSFRRGAILIQEGDTGDTLYMVRSGRLRAYAAHPSGKEITLGIYGAGEYVGEMSLDGGPRSANVETLEPTSCAVISRATLLAYIAEHPAFALEMMARLIRRARLATESASSLALIDVYGRMTRLLDQFASPPAADGTRTVEERITHREIASHLACSREMVTRLAFAPYEKDFLTFSDKIGEEVRRFVELLDRFFKVDDVDAAAVLHQEGLHAGIPLFGLVAVVNASVHHFVD